MSTSTLSIIPMDFATKADAQAARDKLLAARSEAVRQFGPASLEAMAATSAINAVTTRAVELFGQPEVAGCPTCAQFSVFGGPPHHAGRMCQSGGRDHCSCNSCW